MVRFQIMSDVHIETLYDKENPDHELDLDKFIKPTAEILILAGDVGRVNRYGQLKKFMVTLCSKFQAVLYVLGNHEYYRVDNTEEKSMDDILQTVHTLATEIPNLYILDRESIVIDDVCIAGCTLWSYAQGHVPQYIVRVPGMTTAKYNSMHIKDLAYIESMIEYCQKNSLRLVVVTHHCPTFAVTRKRTNDRFGYLYCTDLEELLVREKVHTWICGHIHQNFDFLTEGGTRLVSNQKGKAKDNVTTFSLEKVIEM